MTSKTSFHTSLNTQMTISDETAATLPSSDTSQTRQTTFQTDSLLPRSVADQTTVEHSEALPGTSEGQQRPKVSRTKDEKAASVKVSKAVGVILPSPKRYVWPFEREIQIFEADIKKNFKTLELALVDFQNGQAGERVLYQIIAFSACFMPSSTAKNPFFCLLKSSVLHLL